MAGKEQELDEKIPERIQKYLQVNSINIFMHSKPCTGDELGKAVKTQQGSADNEFVNLWILKKFFITEDKFPSIHTHLEIVEIIEVMLSPIENAINNVKAKNKELKQLIKKHQTPDNINRGPLLMTLSGVIDAAVNGGVAKYQQAFLAPQFEKNNPAIAKLIIELKGAIHEQMDLCDEGLKLNAVVCAEDMKALHSKLEAILAKLKRDAVKLDSPR